DGVETQFGVNYLGHFQLITSLLDVVKKSAPARIVIYAAIGNHTVDKIDYEYLLDKHKYMPYRSCAYSEVANISFANQLADELKNTGVTVNSLSPGMASTGIIRHFPMQGLVNFISRHTCLTPLEGAATAIYLLLSSDVESVTGRYWAHEVIQEPNPNTLDRREQEKLRVFTENFIADIKSKQAASTPSSS
ncbi:Retinol dehydrogenase 14, partial [Spiromyces aspiralis]